MNYFILYLAHDSGRTLVHTKCDIHTPTVVKRNLLLQLSTQGMPQRTLKRPNSEPHGATRQQAIVKTPVFQIPSVLLFL
jgi:hypothetical protein